MRSSLILEVKTGSVAYGVAEETSDEDRVEIYQEQLTFLTPVWESSQHKTSVGDVHRYSLQKYCRLAMAGNPNMLEVLYSPVVKATARGKQLILLRDSFWSKNAGMKFLGYMRAQTERLQGLRGQKDVNRPELVARFGYDVKYAYHIIRLGIIGEEYLKTGNITLPLGFHDRKLLMSIRQGEVAIADIVTLAGLYEARLKHLINEGPAPERPDMDAVESWLQEVYFD